MREITQEALDNFNDALTSAKENAVESHAEDCNSYGAGYDAGLRDGMNEAYRVLLGIDA